MSLYHIYLFKNNLHRVFSSTVISSADILSTNLFLCVKCLLSIRNKIQFIDYQV